MKGSGEKPVCRRVVVVEGKYDRVRLCSAIDAEVIATDGFGIFRDAEKKELVRRLSRERGIVTLVDPDGAGRVIRSYLQTVTGGEGVVHLLPPPRPGKERRKARPSREGLLGVEGIDNETLIALFDKAGLLEENSEKTSKKEYTKYDLYRLGLSGRPDAAKKREEFARRNDLPISLSADSLLAAINLLGLDPEN